MSTAQRLQTKKSENPPNDASRIPCMFGIGHVQPLALRCWHVGCQCTGYASDRFLRARPHQAIYPRIRTTRGGCKSARQSSRRRSTGPIRGQSASIRSTGSLAWHGLRRRSRSSLRSSETCFIGAGLPWPTPDRLAALDDLDKERRGGAAECRRAGNARMMTDDEHPVDSALWGSRRRVLGQGRRGACRISRTCRIHWTGWSDRTHRPHWGYRADRTNWTGWGYRTNWTGWASRTCRHQRRIT